MAFRNNTSYHIVMPKVLAFLCVATIIYIIFVIVDGTLLTRKSPFPVIRSNLSNTLQTGYTMSNVTGLPDCLSGSAKGPLPHNANLCDTFNGRLKKSNCQYYHPKVVYFVKFTNSPEENELNFRDYVSIVSVYKFYKPNKIVILCNQQPLTGKYWQKALNLSTPIELRHTDRVKTIGDKNPNVPGSINHEADYIKVATAYAEGGVFMDFDAVILNGEKLHEMQRKSEIILGRDDEVCGRTCAGFFSSVAQSPFVGGWLNSYKTDYISSSWLHNSGEIPSKMLRTCPHCYDAVVDTHMSNWPDATKRFWLQPGKMNWKEKVVAHYMNSGFMKPIKPKELLNMNTPLTDMFKHILGEEYYEFS